MKPEEAVDVVEDVGTGTPCYVYDGDAIAERAEEYVEAASKAFPGRSVVCYAVKANFNPGVLETVLEVTRAADAVSLWEAKLAGSLGAETIVLNGNAKSREELSTAVREGWIINVDSAEELDTLERIARREDTEAKAALRVNPEVDPETHPHIATAVKGSKFGVPLDEAEDVCRRMIESEHIEFLGLHYHIGSQITDLDPFVQALESVADFLRDTGLLEEISYLNVGGGLGVRYTDEDPPSPGELLETLSPVLRELYDESSGFDLYLEPGRSVVAEAGMLVTEVRLVKRSGGRTWIFVDAGMNALIRPVLYDAEHRVVFPGAEGDTVEASVAGPLCESGDVLAEDVPAPEGLEPGDKAVFMTAGAYCESMASNYNCQPLPASITVKSGRPVHVRRVQAYDVFLGCWSGEEGGP
ncbi:MAG: diaminopimelate decarboxylase [Methanopyri archaeon]|nr:diaminopimelate decarboxylase [Methanopyri archaeon]